MIVEVWVDTPLPGADWRKLVVEANKVFKRLRINYRCLTPEFGVLNRILHVVEWATLEDRERYWSRIPPEHQAINEMRKGLFDETALEHYYYRVVE